MKKIIIFTLGFVFVCILGCVSELIVPELYEHALKTLNGKPLPAITEWSFHHFARWRNGGILCVFILPWALLVLYSLWPRSSLNSTEEHVRILVGFICFWLSESILFLFFITSGVLPFIPIYGIMPDYVPLICYLPHLFLLAVLAGVVIAMVVNLLNLRKGISTKKTSGAALESKKGQ